MRLQLVEGASTRALEPFPILNQGFRESREAQFIAADGWELRIDDETIERHGLTWSWTPGFFAGQVRAELIGPGTTSEWLLDVSPEPTKLGKARFDEMLAELLEEAPALVFGEQASTISVMRGDMPLDRELESLLAFMRLRTRAGEFIRAVRRIEEQPRQALRRKRERVAAHRAQRVDPAALARLLRSSHFKPGDPFAISREATIEVTNSEPTVDCAANRLILELLYRVRQRADLTARALLVSAKRAHDQNVKAGRLARLPARIASLEALKSRLDERLSAWPWRATTRSVDAIGMAGISSDPAYARAVALAFAVLGTGIQQGTSDERLWLSPTWEIFERWCFIRLARQLKESLPGFAWRENAVAHAAASWRGTNSKTEIDLALQPRFPAWDQSASGSFRSLSREREPDLIITIKSEAGMRWLVLDAKYRVSRPNVLDAMSSAHLYRDALRWNGLPPVGSYLLIPAPTECAWLMTADFHAAFRVGVAQFTGELPEHLLDQVTDGLAKSSSLERDMHRVTQTVVHQTG